MYRSWGVEAENQPHVDALAAWPHPGLSNLEPA